MVAPPRSPLHSHPEGHFHVLPSPDLHLIIIGTDVLKVGLGDGEEAAGKRRGSGETEGEACASWGWGEDEQKPGVESCGLGARLPLAPSPLPPICLLSSFLGCAAPLPLPYSFSKRFRSSVVLFPTFWDQVKERCHYHHSL